MDQSTQGLGNTLGNPSRFVDTAHKWEPACHTAKEQPVAKVSKALVSCEYGKCSENSRLSSELGMLSNALNVGEYGGETFSRLRHGFLRYYFCL
jgi:hypothetical protein